MVQTILSYKPDINAIATQKMESITALSIAVESNYVDIVNILLQNNADPNIIVGLVPYNAPKVI